MADTPYPTGGCSFPLLLSRRSPGGLLPLCSAPVDLPPAQEPLHLLEVAKHRRRGAGAEAGAGAGLVGATIGTAGAARATLVARSAVGALGMPAPQAEIPGILGYIP